jgi:hypothetical protein
MSCSVLCDERMDLSVWSLSLSSTCKITRIFLHITNPTIFMYLMIQRQRPILPAFIFSLLSMTSACCVILFFFKIILRTLFWKPYASRGSVCASDILQWCGEQCFAGVTISEDRYLPQIPRLGRHKSLQRTNECFMESGNFSLHYCFRNGSGAHPASYLMGTRGSFPADKAAGAWSWPLTSI